MLLLQWQDRFGSKWNSLETLRAKFWQGLVVSVFLVDLLSDLIVSGFVEHFCISLLRSLKEALKQAVKDSLKESCMEALKHALQAFFGGRLRTRKLHFPKAFRKCTSFVSRRRVWTVTEDPRNCIFYQFLENAYLASERDAGLEGRRRHIETAFSVFLENVHLMTDGCPRWLVSMFSFNLDFIVRHL